MREILTLLVDNVNTRYYIHFNKDRLKFEFHPTLKNRSAPSFTILVQDRVLSVTPEIDESLARQAKDKVKEILSDSIFDQI